MRPGLLDRRYLPLAAILLLVLGSLFWFALRSGMSQGNAALAGDRISAVLLVFEEGGRPVATELFLEYPATGLGAALDIPGETGLILKSLNRVDRIDAVYQKGRPQKYLSEIAGLLGIDIPNWIIFDEEGMAVTADLLGGVEFFIPEAIDQAGPPRIRLAGGSSLLDGDKFVQYAGWKPQDEDDASAAARRQKILASFLRAVSLKSSWLSRSDVFPALRSVVRSNLGADGLRRFVAGLSRIDIDHLLLQRVAGTRRSVDGKSLIFPHYDGDLVKDIVKQTLGALASSQTSPGGNIYSVEILNGTAQKGLANKTAEIYQSFGYEVVRVGNNPDGNIATTRIIQRGQPDDAVQAVAEVIRCREVSPAQGTESLSDADFTVILGTDFNGRYVNGNQP